MAENLAQPPQSNLTSSAQTYAIRKGLSLTIKTNIVLLAVIAVALFAFVYQVNRTMNSSFGEVLQNFSYLQGKTQVKLVAHQFDYLKDELIRLSREPFFDDVMRGRVSESNVSVQLRKALLSNPSFVTSFYIVDLKGTILASSESFDAVGGEAFFINKDKFYKGENMLSDQAFATKKGRGAFGMAQLISSFQEGTSEIQQLGYVVAVLDLDVFTSYITYRDQNNGVLAYVDSFILTDTYDIIVKPQNPNIIESSGLDFKTISFLQSSFSLQTNQGSHLQVEKISGTNWFLFTLISSELQAREIAGTRQVLAITSLASLIFLAFVISVFIRLMFMRRIHDFKTIVSFLAESNLSIKFKPANGDELGTTAQQMEIYVANLRSSIEQITKECNNADHSSEELGEDFNEFLNSLQTIINQVDQTRLKITQQNNYVNDTSAVVEQLAQNISSLDLSIEKQSASVEESSSAIEEMIGSIQSINRITEHARESVEELKTSSDAGKKNQQEVVAQIREIAHNSEQLQEANTLIASIASQTNLLSMNAAIEASHAGEAGKGFAVVAEEIRDLAEQVADQSESVAKTISEIMSSIESTVSVADAAGSSFENILEKVHSVYQVMEEISQTMQEQTNGSKEILIALSSVRDISYEVKTGSSEMAQGNMQILNAIEGLRDTSREVSSNADRIGEILGHIDTASERINELRTQNQKNIHGILHMLKSFKL